MQVLVSHDGELDDVCVLLRELGCEPVVRCGALPLADLARAFDLVIATPARALRVGTLLAQPETRSIVVAEHGTRTAGRRLHQLGVEWIVRRPVHPAALRLLLRHSLYRGPERRRAGRVSIGLPVRYRAGWRSRRALLRDMSLRGASLISNRALPLGRRIWLQVEDAGQGCTLAGEVVRCRPVADGQVEVGIALDAHPMNPAPTLRELMARYARGPASCAEVAEPELPAALYPARHPAPPSAAPGSTPSEPAASAADRRESARHPFGRRVIALHEDAPRVLIGRDLSLGGMSVELGAPLEAGQHLKLALHVRAGEIPLVVDAEVVRADGGGAGLRFESLSDTSRGYLAKMLDALPALAAPSARLGEERRVLAELVE
jgi:hypothetical protein